MTGVIYEPLELYEKNLKESHTAKTEAYLEELVKRSAVNVEENRKTVQEYKDCLEANSKLKKKLNWMLFFRVLMCITILLIPVVIWKLNPKIKDLRTQIQEADQRAEQLLALAHKQMQPLNELFTDRDALNLIEQTIPLLRFENCLSVRQETDMRINYDFPENNDQEQSTLDVLAGSYNENPFLFENKLIHTMGVETYHGYKTIYWTEYYRDSNGKTCSRTRSETLHATVTKPKPFYTTQVVLNYCSQGGPDLSFTRDATGLHQKNDKAIDRLVKKGEKKLQKKADKAVKNNSDFTSMSNTEFEVLFDALDRDNEVQFRTLFTPLAQTNMVALLLSKIGFGDDFNFIKQKRTNRIVSHHSQGREINLLAWQYRSYDFDVIKENFVGKNTAFFKAVYFDFAPLWAIPVYQERPVHSLKPIPDYSQLYSLKESEALANAVDAQYVVHPDTKTQAILKSTYLGRVDNMDETSITAYSYDIEKLVDYVSMLGGDGKIHSVAVEWDNYLPLEAEHSFCIGTAEQAAEKDVIARRNGLCIFES